MLLKISKNFVYLQSYSFFQIITKIFNNESNLMKRTLTTVILAAAVGIGCINAKELTANYAVVPMPHSIENTNGQGFKLNAKTVISYPKGNITLKRDAEFLAEYLKQQTGLKLALTTAPAKSNAIVLSLGLNNVSKEAYELKINQNIISINAAAPAGVFYGIQTLRKSIPEAGKNNITFPAATIKDSPRFAYRGAMLDTSRHLYPVDSIKSYIDMLALHNINRFHWHITDDQGWRIEIKSLPELIKKGSMRKGTMVGKNFNSSDNKPYGGYYTQAEIRDLVKYAAERHITIVPEIDMPGHMLAALTAYPNLGCTGGPYDVWQRWGVSDDVLCAGNPDVLKFIDTVLGEVLTLFPSEYIHVGGDECPKTRWKTCPKCQAKAKELGFTNGKHTVEEQLQSYIIRHASKFLTSKGRKMIGWDETLEGGLAPGAIVMSWRGEEGAIEAAKQGHDAIMTPTGYMYFDYYQSTDRKNEPLAIGGYVPVSKVYSFNPTPNALSDEEKKHIIGVQANLWTEYIPTYAGVEYMELPRLAALSEVQWSDAEKRNYNCFTKRMPQLVNIYNERGYNYAKHIFDIAGQISPNTEKKSIDISLSTIDNAPIYYTLDGTTPTAQSSLYTGPIAVTKPSVLKALAIRPESTSRLYKDSIAFNKATASKITLAKEPGSRYRANGAITLVDGKYGSSEYGDGAWVGFLGQDMDAILDLGKPTEISQLDLRTNVRTGDWIFDVTQLKLEVSDNGKDFTTIALKDFPIDQKHFEGIRNHKLTFAPVTARYVRVVANSLHELPAWFNDSKAPAYIFIDEIGLR